MTTKHETIEVSGVVLYCDECKARGPEEAYDNHNALIQEAKLVGWDAGDDRDLCPECVTKKRAEENAAKRRARRGATRT